MTTLKSQFGALVGSRILASAVQAATVVTLARLVGPERFGPVGVLTGTLTVLLSVADLGLSSFIAKARAQDRRSAVAGALRLNRLSTIAAAFLISSTSLITNLFPIVLILLVWALAIEKNVDTSLGIFIADGKRSVPVFSVLLRRLTTLAAFAAFVAIHTDPVLAYCAGSLLGAVFGQVHIAVAIARAVDTSQHSKMLDVLKNSLPFLVSNLTVQLRLLDTTIVSQIVSVGAAGLYAFSQRITNPFMVIPGAMATLLLPHSSRASASSARKSMRLLVALTIACMIICLPIAIFAGPILSIVGGDRYAPAASALGPMLLGFPFIAFSSPMGSVLQGQGAERYVAWNGITFALTTIVATFAGAASAGISGAAFSVAVAYACKCCSLYFYAEKYLRPRGQTAESSVDDIQRSYEGNRE